MNKKFVLGFLTILLVAVIIAGVHAYKGGGLAGSITGFASYAQTPEMKQWKDGAINYFFWQMVDYRKTKLASTSIPTDLYPQTLKNDVLDRATKLESFYNSTTSVLRLENNISIAEDLNNKQAVWEISGGRRDFLRLSPIEQSVAVAGYYSMANRMKNGFMASVEVIHTIDLLLGESSFGGASAILSSYPNVALIFPEAKNHFSTTMRQTALPDDGITLDKLSLETVDIMNSWRQAWDYDLSLLALGETLNVINAGCSANPCIVKGNDLLNNNYLRDVPLIRNMISADADYDVIALLSETETNYKKNQNLIKMLESMYPWIVGKQFRQSLGITDGFFLPDDPLMPSWHGDIDYYKTYPADYYPQNIDAVHVKSAITEQIKSNRDNLLEYLGKIEAGLSCIYDSKVTGLNFNVYDSCKGKVKDAIEKSPPAPRFERLPVTDSKSIKYMFANYYLDLVEDAKEIQKARDEADSTTKILIIGTALVIGGAVSGPISSISMLYRGSLATVGPVQGAVGVATLAGNAVYTGVGVYDAVSQCEEIMGLTDTVHVGRRMIPDPENPDQLIPNPVQLGPQDVNDLSNCAVIGAFTALNLAGVVGIPPFISTWFGNAKAAAQAAGNTKRVAALDMVEGMNTKTFTSEISASRSDHLLDIKEKIPPEQIESTCKKLGMNVQLTILPDVEYPLHYVRRLDTSELNRFAIEMNNKMGVPVYIVDDAVLDGAAGRFVTPVQPGQTPRIELSPSAVLTPWKSIQEFALSGNTPMHEMLHAVLQTRIKEEAIKGTGLLVNLRGSKNIAQEKLGYDKFLSTDEVITQTWSKSRDVSSRVANQVRAKVFDRGQPTLGEMKEVIESRDFVSLRNRLENLGTIFYQGGLDVRMAGIRTKGEYLLPGVTFESSSDTLTSTFKFKIRNPDFADEELNLVVKRTIDKVNGEFLNMDLQYTRTVFGEKQVISCPLIDTDEGFALLEIEAAAKRTGTVTLEQEEALLRILPGFESELLSSERLFYEGSSALKNVGDKMDELSKYVDDQIKTGIPEGELLTDMKIKHIRSLAQDFEDARTSLLLISQRAIPSDIRNPITESFFSIRGLTAPAEYEGNLPEQFKVAFPPAVKTATTTPPNP